MLQSEERQDRETQKNAHADAQAEVAGMRGFEYGEAENNQQGAERRDESPQADLARHAGTLTHAMTTQGYNGARRLHGCERIRTAVWSRLGHILK